jgi:hypothetical protein
MILYLILIFASGNAIQEKIIQTEINLKIGLNWFQNLSANINRIEFKTVLIFIEGRCQFSIVIICQKP